MTHNEFKLVFEEHKHSVYRFASRMTNSSAAAEDVAQEVFMTLLRRPDAFDPNRGQLRNFLFAITCNLVLKRWRDERHWEPLEDEAFIAAPITAADDDTALAVAHAVKSLPPLQREVLVLAEYEDLSLAEIAQTVECEVGTVKARLHRARENLRRMLAPLRNRLQPGDKLRTRHGSTK